MGNMGKRVPAIFYLAAFAGAGVVGALGASAQTKQHTKSPGSAPPLRFERRAESSDSTVKYSARTASYSLFLSDNEADVVLHGESTPRGKVTRGKLIVVRAYANLLRLRFMDSNLPTSIGPVGRENQSLAHCTALAYRGIYPGTDLIVRGDQRRIGFQLDLGPGAAGSNHIVLEIAGATSIQLNSDGDAIVYSGRESLELQRPIIALGAAGRSKSIPGAYKIEGGNRLRFIVNALTFENSPAISD